MSSQTRAEHNPYIGPTLSPQDRALFQAAWDLSRAHHGDDLTFYLPGMIRCGGLRGRYPAISLTGPRCQLQCEHCKGRLLETMPGAEDPAALLEAAKRLAGQAHGMLLSGGSDPGGNIPWDRFAGAIREIKDTTGLFLSAHVGFPNREACRLLNSAGVSQALIDVMGDPETATEVYHLSGLARVVEAMEAIRESGMEFVPHIVTGLHYGRMKGEYHALDLIGPCEPSAVVIVVITPLAGTPMESITPPSPLEVSRLIAHARLRMPHVPISLGCERPRNRDGERLERLALQAGVTRMALWSDETVSQAGRMGLRPLFQGTCCSVQPHETYTLPVSPSGSIRAAE